MVSSTEKWRNSQLKQKLDESRKRIEEALHGKKDAEEKIGRLTEEVARSLPSGRGHFWNVPFEFVDKFRCQL